MGKVPLIIVGGFVLGALSWYLIYARGRIKREYALLHVVERVTGIKQTDRLLEEELREILIERDNVTEKRFYELMKKCPVIEFDSVRTAKELAKQVANSLAVDLNLKPKKLLKLILRLEKEPEVIIHSGIACLSIPIHGHNKFEIMLVRDREGVIFSDPLSPVYAAFILVFSPDEWNFHFHSLSWIVEIAEVEDFEKRWLQASGCESLRNIMLALWKQRIPNYPLREFIPRKLTHLKYWK